MADRQNTMTHDEEGSYTYESVSESEDGGVTTIPAYQQQQQAMGGQPAYQTQQYPQQGQQAGVVPMASIPIVGADGQQSSMMVQLSPEAIAAALQVQQAQASGAGGASVSMASMSGGQVGQVGQMGNMGQMQIQIHLDQNALNQQPQPVQSYPSDEQDGEYEDSVEHIEPQLTMEVEYETAKDRERQAWERQEKCNRIGFCVAILVFVVPIVLVLFDLYTDYVLITFITSTRSTYVNSITTIRGDIFPKTPPPNVIAECRGGNKSLDSIHALYTFIQVTPSINCSCSQTILHCPSNTIYLPFSGTVPANSNPLNATATNYQAACATNSGNITCNVCDCGAMSPYSLNSPQMKFADAKYPGLTFSLSMPACDVVKMRKFAANDADDELSVSLGHEYRSAWAFFILSVLVQICAITASFRVRWKDIKRTWERLNYEPPDPDEGSQTIIQQDAFTWLVMLLVLGYAIQDVPQSVIAVFFSIDKQRPFGADCFERLAAQGFSDGNPPIGPDISSPWFFLFNDPPMVLFFIATFTNTYIGGTMAVRALGFQQEKMHEYKWYHWVFYILGGILCGFLALYIVLAPMFGAIWWTGANVNLVGGARSGVQWTAVSGLALWGIVCCLPCCFLGQLGDAMGCDAGCDCGCGC